MDQQVRARRFALAAALLLVGTAADAQIQPDQFASLAFRQHPGGQVPLDAALIDEQGRPTSLGRVLDGRPAVLVLEYLRCRNLCGLVLRGATVSINGAGLEPGRDVELIGVSIDPRDQPRDAAAARAMYSGQFGDPVAASRGVRFLTGSPEQVSRIAAAVGFRYRYDRKSDQFAHPAGFAVLTPSGRISHYMLGLSPSASELRRAVQQASVNEITPPAYPLLCLCFGYDPDEGTVAALAMRLVRIASVGLVLGCIALVAFLSLRRRAA